MSSLQDPSTSVSVGQRGESIKLSCVFRPAKGRDDSDDEDGASRPRKQRKPKEGRKKIERVCFKYSATFYGYCPFQTTGGFLGVCA